MNYAKSNYENHPVKEYTKLVIEICIGSDTWKKEAVTVKYVCDVCGWIYDEALGDPDLGIAPGTKFEDLPEDFLCPLCSVGKDFFSEMGD